MGEWLEWLVPWGTEIIVWVQSLSNAWIDAVAIFFTGLGYEEFYLLALPLIYWCIHRQIGIGLAYASLLSAWLNSVLKYVFRIPRPADPRIRIPLPETSPAFPSGHAQNAVINWGYLAIRFQNPIFWGVAIIAIVGIGLSRVVLGVHYPQDVIAGWLIGLVFLAVYIWAEPHVSRWVGRQGTVLQLVLAVAVPLALGFLHPADLGGRYPADSAITAMSTLAGLGIGVIMERAWVRFRVEGVWWRRGLRYLAGLIIVGLFYAGPKLLIPDDLPYSLETVLRFLRYGVLGWVVAFLVPWIMIRLRLADTES
ncbi:phosphatase PAP2 family protein [Chloroflexota bacterium]